jgi:hypothetical protein
MIARLHREQTLLENAQAASAVEPSGCPFANTITS